MTPTKRRRVSRRAIIAGAGGLAIALAVGADAWFGHPVEHAAYWRWRLLTDPADAPTHVELLGDSSIFGTGAARPSESLAGRVVAHVESRRGTPVRACNRSPGGGTVREVLDQQVPAADLERADLVLVSVGSNDVGARSDLTAFTRDMAGLLDALPPERTLFSDIAAVPGVEPYQAAFAPLAEARGIGRIPFTSSFEAAGRRDVMAPDGRHLNSTGYGIWFDGARPRIDEVLARPR